MTNDQRQMTNDPRATMLRLALPKGRMQDAVLRLLGDGGVPVHIGPREYRPAVGLDDVEAKLLKPQNVIEMLHAGSRDLGFAGADWVKELDADLVELLDTGLNPVRLVAAAPEEILEDGRLPARPLVIASEYERITTEWIERTGLDARFVHSAGATEVFPPEDADCIVDNTATGSTLAANDLVIVDELLRSSTRLYANPAAMEHEAKRERIEQIILLLRSVLDARRRVLIEINVQGEQMEQVASLLPCMREPTIAPLHGNGGFAIKSAVPSDGLADLIPRIKAAGGSDIVISPISQIVS